MKDYSQVVAQQADEYNQNMIQVEKDKKEAKHFDDLDEEAMIQIRSKGIPHSSNLVQISSEIKFEPEDELAIGYMASQFPAEYDNRSDEEVQKQKPATIAQEAEQQKADMVAYAKQVSQDANAYSEQIA